jgi:hypothetical protein
MLATRELPTVRTRQRFRRHPCSLYIRKVKGSKYQLRWWLARVDPSAGSVNCGLYASEWLAERVRTAVVKELRNHHPTALGVWSATRAVLRAMVDQGQPVAAALKRLLPKWVRRTDGGYAARVKVWGQRIVLPGPFATPEDAHRAMKEHLEHLAEAARGRAPL